MLSGYRRVGVVLLLLGIGLTAPVSVQAAYVTAVDVSVRPAEGSPWSKGTLFRGEGFSVGATTGNGWAWGRAGGEADRCGWVLISELNSTTPTDTQCGTPKTEPLGDSEHVPGGGASERWYVTCESATLFGNYGGAAGVLRSPAGSASKAAAVGWRYTTGNGYAASIDGPTGTPRFILRSCISRTPPAGAPGPAPGPAPGAEPELIGPELSRLLDEEGLFELFGRTPLVRESAFASAGPPTVDRTRATIRLARGNIVIANGLEGDPFDSSGIHCEGWVLGTVSRETRRYRGWVQMSALNKKPMRTRRGCRTSVGFDDRIKYVNAPFRSITWLRTKRLQKGKQGLGAWGTTGSASQSRLRRAPDGKSLATGCGLYMNYDPNPGGGPGTLQDEVTPERAKKLFASKDTSTAVNLIGYRYTSPAEDVALVSVKTGFKKGPKGKRKNVGLWAFVRRSCVVPVSTYGKSRVNTIFQTRIRICDQVRPSQGAGRLNRIRRRTVRREAVKPCALPNSASTGKVSRPDSRIHGWDPGVLRLSG